MTILGIIGIVFGSLLGLILLYLVFVVFGPMTPIEGELISQTRDTTKAPNSRSDVVFQANGETIRAYLYLPPDLSGPVPCIVMNQGFGGTKDMGLEPFALRYVDAGFAALTFDFRHFGKSEGEPRQLFSATKQLDDCMAAVEYARSRSEINSDKIAVWGTSASGGYGLVASARDKKIACVCGQCPTLDGHADGKLSVEREGLWFFISFLPHAQRDKGRSRFGLSPHTIPIVGLPGTKALITAPGALEGYSKLANGRFENKVCARLALDTDHHKMSPILHAKDVECPVLLQPCEKDNFVSLDAALRTKQILGDKGLLKTYPCGHFDIYFGEFFEQCISDQVEFFSKHLL